MLLGFSQRDLYLLDLLDHNLLPLLKVVDELLDDIGVIVEAAYQAHLALDIGHPLLDASVVRSNPLDALLQLHLAGGEIVLNLLRLLCFRYIRLFEVFNVIKSICNL